MAGRMASDGHRCILILVHSCGGNLHNRSPCPVPFCASAWASTGDQPGSGCPLGSVRNRRRHLYSPFAVPGSILWLSEQTLACSTVPRCDGVSMDREQIGSAWMDLYNFR